MDEETSVALVKRAWSCVGRHDLNALLDLLAPDIIWEIPSMPAVPFAGYGGVGKACLSFSRLWTAAQEIVEFAPEAFIADGRNGGRTRKFCQSGDIDRQNRSFRLGASLDGQGGKTHVDA